MYQLEEFVRKVISRTTRLTGVALALSAGAVLALGVTPANADTKFISVKTNYHGKTRPAFGQFEAETRSGADQQCVAAFGFRARGVEYTGFHGGGSDANGWNWWTDWDCTSN
jgi:hypothetical protein